MSESNSISKVTPLEAIGAGAAVPSPTAVTRFKTAVQKAAEKKAAGKESPTKSQPKPIASQPSPVEIDPPSDNGRSKGISTSVYFSKPAHLTFLAELGKKFPRASVSSVMTQLLEAFYKATKDKTVTNNQVKIEDTVIYL